MPITPSVVWLEPLFSSKILRGSLLFNAHLSHLWLTPSRSKFKSKKPKTPILCQVHVLHTRSECKMLEDRSYIFYSFFIPTDSKHNSSSRSNSWCLGYWWEEDSLLLNSWGSFQVTVSLPNVNNRSSSKASTIHFSHSILEASGWWFHLLPYDSSSVFIILCIFLNDFSIHIDDPGSQLCDRSNLNNLQFYVTQAANGKPKHHHLALLTNLFILKTWNATWSSLHPTIQLPFAQWTCFSLSLVIPTLALRLFSSAYESDSVKLAVMLTRWKEFMEESPGSYYVLTEVSLSFSPLFLLDWGSNASWYRHYNFELL